MPVLWALLQLLQRAACRMAHPFCTPQLNTLACQQGAVQAQ